MAPCALGRRVSVWLVSLPGDSDPPPLIPQAAAPPLLWSFPGFSTPPWVGAGPGTRWVSPTSSPHSRPTVLASQALLGLPSLNSVDFLGSRHLPLTPLYILCLTPPALAPCPRSPPNSEMGEQLAAALPAPSLCSVPCVAPGPSVGYGFQPPQTPSFSARPCPAQGSTP